MGEQKRGLQVGRYFTKEGIHPFSQFAFERRSSTIKNPDGSIVFHMDDVEVPSFWSSVATDILAQKYFRKAGVPLQNEGGEPLLDENGKRITGSETSIKQVAHRMAGCWRSWGEKYGYFATESDAQIFYEEMLHMIVNQTAAPNSPQWFTTGLHWAYGLRGPAQGHSYVDPDTKELKNSQDAYTRNQPHACFIQAVEDDLVREGGIFSLLVREARVFKYGSGTGTNFSRLRGKGERLSGGGTSSGVMSFLKIFDVAAGSVKSGGTTRRAAKMVCLDMDHPEIEEFIWWKVREEEKVASLVAGSRVLKKKLAQLMQRVKGKENPLADQEVQESVREAARQDIPLNYIVRAIALAQQGYDLPLREFDTHYESEAYVTVSGQNSNNSIRIPNEFFTALQEGREWALRGRTSGEIMKTISAEKLWDDVGYCAWASADPGVQFDTTMNEWHTCPKGGKINASNPCSEYLFLDDTACNLASINLVKCYDVESGVFDIQGYMHAIRLWTMALEISVLMAHFPSEAIARKSYEYRTLGLGYANLGTLLMLQGVPYDSEQGRAIAGALTAILTGEAYATSAELAQALGPFERFAENREDMLRVIRNHRRVAYNENMYEGLSKKPVAIGQQLCPPLLLQAAHTAWDRALSRGEQSGYRNAQVSVLAPTGTIGLVMDCDTTGVEPDYALVKMKKLAGGGYFKIVNQSVPNALRRLGYLPEQITAILAYCVGHGTLEGSPGIDKETLLMRGLSEKQLDAVEKGLHAAMDIRHVFNPWVLGEKEYQRLLHGSKGDVLRALGFTDAEIAAANEYVCGTMTLEGAPYLREEHYAVFDCANKCGKNGKRYIHPYGHLKMLAAAQPFISGAISKTINMPQEWGIGQIKQAYYDAWTMMIKAVALYRDGCKLSQPLNATLEEHPELREILQETHAQEVKKCVLLGRKELLLSARKEGERIYDVQLQLADTTPAQQALFGALVNSVNMGLQHGIHPEQIAEHSLVVEGHPVIAELRTFLLENGAPAPREEHISRGRPRMIMEDRAPSRLDASAAEKCSSCGAAQLRQNGTCHLCEVCGETTGCS